MTDDLGNAAKVLEAFRYRWSHAERLVRADMIVLPKPSVDDDLSLFNV